MVLAPQAQTLNPKKDNPTAASIQVSLSTERRVYRVGETVHITYSVRNTGTQPVYVAQNLDFEGNPNGGVSVDIVSPPKAKVFITRLTGSPPPEFWKGRNMVKEIEEHWLLLRPAHFYGKTARLELVPLSPGKYTIRAAYIRPYLTEEEIKAIGRLKYPIILENQYSKSVNIQVVK